MFFPWAGHVNLFTQSITLPGGLWKQYSYKITLTHYYIKSFLICFISHIYKLLKESWETVFNLQWLYQPIQTTYWEVTFSKSLFPLIDRKTSNLSSIHLSHSVLMVGLGYLGQFAYTKECHHLWSKLKY